MLVINNINEGAQTTMNTNFSTTEFANPSWHKKIQINDKNTNEVRMLLSGNPNTPISVLDDLDHHEESPALLERVAENPNTSPDTLAKLAIHDDPRVRAAVAVNPSMPEKIIWRLAIDIHPDVRLRLAESYFLPRYVLEVLAQDDNPYVQLRAQRTIDRLKQPSTVSLSLGCC